MGPKTSSRSKLSSSQISVAAEAFAAAHFALSGFDVLEHAGRGQLFFDLSVARAGGMMKISVHASFNGFWDLADRYLTSSRHGDTTAEDYHRAIECWLDHHGSMVTCCLVEFESAQLHRMPHLYLASPEEVAALLHEKIDQFSNEELVPNGLDVVHRLEGLPLSWRFSQARIAEIMELPVEERQLIVQHAAVTKSEGCTSTQQADPADCLSLMN